MRAYEYAADKSTTIRDMSPIPVGTMYVPNFKLTKGDLFLVLLTPEKRLYFFPGSGGPKIQVPTSTARAFLEGKCRISENGMRAIAAAEAKGALVGNRVYIDRVSVLENGSKFRYCDGGPLILDERGHLKVSTRFNGRLAKNAPYTTERTEFDPERDIALLEKLLTAWDFMTEPTRFAVQRIRERLAEQPQSVRWLGRFNAVWKSHEKNPYAVKRVPGELRPLF